jgi:hypothetical protein
MERSIIRIRTATAIPAATFGANHGSEPGLPGNSCFELNSGFGQLIKSYDQEGVTARREIRLRARITF